MEPLELEMHACKNMHVLLGCKAALWDFIQDVKGEDGDSPYLTRRIQRTDVGI
jgi:hypothetical protein